MVLIFRHNLIFKGCYDDAYKKALELKDKESFSDRDGDDVHSNDTMQELVSLSERFGIHVTFSKPDKNTYLHIVKHLAKENNIDLPSDELELRAERFALTRGNRSARLARQFIDNLLSK